MNALAQINTDTAVRIPVPGTDYMVCSTVCGLGGLRYTVLFNGRYFVVTDYQLDLMKRGQTPDDLELEEAEGDE